ncbi:MAG: hypothetical protein GF309_16290 [Candidatus Lokiarchaeota archaeon]|nr:hypothetical protein [Candidatus Lokiarchaeota archaeon]
MKWALEDVDHDGDIDLILYFRTQELELTRESSEAVPSWETMYGAHGNSY